MAPLFRRLASMFALAVVLLALAGAPAGARIGTCRGDPVVRIDGQIADIVLSSHDEMKDAATGPAKVVVTVPSGVPAELVATDRGFGGHGYDVRFAESDRLRVTERGLEVRIEVYAPATDGSLPVWVEFTPRGEGRLSAGSAEGRANAWVTLTTR